MIVKPNADEIASYFSDAANYQGNCDVVYFPENTGEVAELLKKANRENIKITVSGAGTGLTGGRVPLEGVVLATDKLNKIIEIDKEKKIASVQPGVFLSEFKSGTENENMFYPPDPTENECYIGGTIATNASGAKSFKYGATRAFVNALEIVLPSGEILKLKRGENFAEKNKLTLNTDNGKEYQIELPEINMPNVKHAAGYFVKPDMDAIDLFIGAEGTLGVVTRAELKLLDKPREVISAVVFFSDENDALEFIAEARNLSYAKRRGEESLIDALALEFFDGKALAFLKDRYPNVKDFHKAAVWFEQDITDEDSDAVSGKWFELIEKHNGDAENSWFAVDESKRREFRDFRHAVSQKISDYISAKNLRKVGTDTAVPYEKFPDFYYGSKKLVENAGLSYVAYGHFGDSHLHLNMLPSDEKEYETAKKIYKEICRNAVNLGGTVSAEHGIGKLKREYFELMYSEKEIYGMAKIKKTLDPKLILNFGNIFFEKYLV